MLDDIRLRAYFKWQNAGSPPGDGVSFWLEAEREYWERSTDKLGQAVYWLMKFPYYEMQGKPAEASVPDWHMFITVPDLQAPERKKVEGRQTLQHPPQSRRFSWRLLGQGSLERWLRLKKKRNWPDIEWVEIPNEGYMPRYKPPPAPPSEWPDWCKLVFNFLTNELQAKLEQTKFTLADVLDYLPWLADDITSLLFLRLKGVLSAKQVKDVFPYCWDGVDALTAIFALDILSVAQEDVVATTVAKYLAASPKVVEDYKKGKKQALNSLIGPVLRELGGKADATRVRAALEEQAAKL